MRAGAAVLLGAVVTTGAAGTAPAVSELAVPQRANANASIAVSGSSAALAWGASNADGVTDVYTSLSTDGGRTFGPAHRVNAVPGEAKLAGEQPARIALVPRPGTTPSIVVVWTAKGTQGTRLLSARSDDGGQTFSPAVSLPGSDAAGNRGWESIAADRGGRVAAIWLDHRETVGAAGGHDMNHAGHQHATSGEQRADGAARAQLSKLFFGWLDDAAGGRPVTGGVCYCCKTSVATGPDGVIYAAWRHVYPGNVRDIAFAMSADGGRTFGEPVRVSDDNWVLDGCPENGPSLAVDDGGRVHVVWPTLVPAKTAGDDPVPALFYATSADGRRFTPRQLVPTEGFPRHPQIAIGSTGEVVAVWDEQVDNGKRIALARGVADGAGVMRFVRQTLGDAAPGTYPVVAAGRDSSLVAWVSGTGAGTVIRVERLTE